jgi:hypothetical protein
MYYSLVVTTMRASGKDISSNCMSWLNLRFVRHFSSPRKCVTGTYRVKILPLSTLLKNESGALSVVRYRRTTINIGLCLRHDSLSKSIVKLYTRLDSHHIERPPVPVLVNSPIDAKLYSYQVTAAESANAPSWSAV